MSNKANMIPIPGRLHSVAEGEPVCGSDEVLYEPEGQTAVPQSELNKRVADKLPASVTNPFNGLGRVVLPMNLVDVEESGTTVQKNVLTKTMINQANTIYVIQYDFTLDENINVPANCVLEFDGGSVSGAYTITGTNTLIIGNVSILCNVDGNVTNDYVTPQMFGAKADGATNDTKAFQNCIKVSDNIYIPNGNYIVTLQYRGESVHNGILITRSNVHMKFEQNAVLRGVVDSSVPKPSGGYTGVNRYYGNIIRIHGDIDNFIENITIEGGVFIGVRSEFARSISARTEEDQCAISCQYTKNTVIKNCVIKDNQGDSVIAYSNYNILVQNIKSYDTRRTGVSIGPCEGFTIDGCFFYDNGSDKQYGNLMNYGTAPNYAVCLEGDITETSPLRKFNGVVVKNCYAEYGKNGASSDVFVARNQPAFFLAGQLADGGDTIVIENNTLVNKNNNESSIYNITIDLRDTEVNNVTIKNNKFVSKLESTAENSGCIMITDCYVKNVEIINNIYDNNQNFVWLYQSSTSNKTDNVKIDGNICNNIDNLEAPHAFLYAQNTGVHNIVITNNVHTGFFITNYGNFNSLLKAEVLNNIVNTNFGEAANKGFVKFRAPYSSIINICNNSFNGSFDKTDGSPWYFVQGVSRKLDASKNPTEVAADAVYVETPFYNVRNNVVRATGRNFYFSDFWSGFNGEVVNNKIYAPYFQKMGNNLIPSDHLYIVRNICSKKMIDNLLGNEIINLNIYDDGQQDIPLKGTFANRPSTSPIGYQYFCTDKQTTEGATNGIAIIHKGSDVWVDALGRVVS